MSKRYTERAQLIVLNAQEEAKRLNHDYVGTEHILLGLIAVGEGVAVQVLSVLGIDLSRVHQEVGKIVGTGDTAVPVDDLPFTSRAKNVLNYAEEEAQYMGHPHVDTEHLLLGILREDEGVAARVLENLGLRLGRVREEVLSVLGEKKPEAGTGPRDRKAELIHTFITELIRSHLPITAVEAAIDAARNRIHSDELLDMIGARLVDRLFK